MLAGMAVRLGNRSCVDPAALARDCQDQGLPLDWWGRANLFRNPLGRGPGAGAVLLTKADLDALDQTADHALVFEDDRRPNAPITLRRITLLRAQCVTPGHRDDARAVYLCEIVDRRHFLALVPVDAAYNVRNADGDDYLSETTNGGTAWTWQQVVTDLRDTLGLADSFTLPFTPDGTPENLRYHAGWAWEALNDVLDRLACAVKYDPVADAFTLVRLGDSATTAAVALSTELGTADRDGMRVWDKYHVEPNRGRLPEKVRVLFPRRPVPTDGSSPWYAEDVTLTATTGVAAGTFVQLRDDLTAIGSGTPTNAAALTTRAAERAADWRRKRVWYEKRVTLVYRDFRPAMVPGETMEQTALDDHGGPMTTVLESGPDGAMEGFEPWAPPVLVADSAATPAPSVTPLNCPVSSPDACCLPTDADCCPTIYYEMLASPTAGVIEAGVYYYVDCDGNRVYSHFTGWALPAACGGSTTVGYGNGIVCTPDPTTGAERYFYDGECLTCAELTTLSQPCETATATGPVCVTVAGGTGAFAGVACTSAETAISPDMSLAVSCADETLGISIVGTLVFNAGSPAGWFFVGTATSTQDAGSVPYECGCRVELPAGLISGSGVTQTITAGPTIGDPPTQTLLVETPCGDFTIEVEACPAPPSPPTYNCVANIYCVDPGDGTGTYTGGTALADCQAACTEPSVPPVPATCCDGTGESLEGYTGDMELTIPNGPMAGTYTLTYSASVTLPGGGYGPGWRYAFPWPYTNGVAITATCDEGVWVLGSGTIGGAVLGTMYLAQCSPFVVLFEATSGQWASWATLVKA